jgi:hypothetical protein
MSVHSDVHKTYERALKAKNYAFHSFYTVAAAKEFLSELNNPKLKLFAEDHINSRGHGVKCYVVCTWKTMYYLSMKFSTNFYEWIEGDVPVKLHLDIDCKEEMFDGRTQKEALDYYIKQSVEYVNETVLPLASIKKGKYIVLKSENTEGKARSYYFHQHPIQEHLSHQECVK